MFIISQYALKQLNIVPNTTTMTTYAIVSGVVIYACLYAYIMLCHKNLIPFFNKILTYVVGVDILLSMIYYYTIINSQKQSNSQKKEKYNESILDESNFSTDSDDETNCDLHDDESDDELHMTDIADIADTTDIADMTDIADTTDKKPTINIDNMISSTQHIFLPNGIEPCNDKINNMINNNTEVPIVVNTKVPIVVNTEVPSVVEDKINLISINDKSISNDDKSISNDDNNLLNNLISALNNNSNVLINDNITNIMNNTTESVPTVKKRKRRSKKEIEQEELLKNLVPDSELNDD